MARIVAVTPDERASFMELADTLREATIAIERFCDDGDLYSLDPDSVYRGLCSAPRRIQTLFRDILASREEAVESLKEFCTPGSRLRSDDGGHGSLDCAGHGE